MKKLSATKNMAQNVMVTGAGRSYALGYNMVLRYLENGDNVIATVRKESEEWKADSIILQRFLRLRL